MTNIKLDKIEDAISAIKKGEIIIVVDDENRENEGDFITAAETIDSSKINFMAKNGRGLICVPMSEKLCSKLSLEKMVPNNTYPLETAFTVSVDFKGNGVTSGISASDRSKTVKALVDNKTNIYKQNFSVVKSDKKAISFTNVSFKYFNSEVEIFEDLNLKIEKNNHTIITGPNGSGKSTLLGLSAGLLFPQKWKIVSYSNKFGYVGVTPLIISGTLRDNLVYGNSKNIPDEDLIGYLEKFQVFNESAGNNLDNVVNNKILSSGQLQKISFIRSLISDVDILLLDESTSNLDENSRKLIFDLLNKSEMTIINSTHNHQDFNYDNHLKIVIENEKRLIIHS